MNKKYIYKKIKEADKLCTLIFDYLYKLNDKSLERTIWRLTEVGEILSELEIVIELEMEEKNEQL